MRSKSKQHIVVLVIAGTVLLAIAGYLTPQVLRDWGKIDATQTVPARVRLADLTSNGVTVERHVLLTDFQLGDKYAYEVQKETATGRDLSWTALWVPLFPKSAGEQVDEKEQAQPRSFTVLLLTTDVFYKQDSVKILRNRQPLDVLVHPPGTKAIDKPFESTISNILKKAYPDVDLSQCAIVEEIRREDQTFSRSDALVKIGGMVVCYAIGVFALAMGLVKWRRWRNSTTKPRDGIDSSHRRSRRGRPRDDDDSQVD